MPDLGQVEAAVAALVSHCAQAGLPLPPQARERLERYVRLLLFWNERVSLTGAKTAEEVALHHILDSLHVLPLLRAGQTVADAGSGAGFPGIPLAICHPGCSFVLIEPRRKRANFLRACVRELGLPGVRVEEARVEDLYEAFARYFDVVVSRALVGLAAFARLSAPLLRPNGILVAMKGPHPEAELASLPGEFEVVEVRRYALPERWGERSLVVLRSVQPSRFT